MRAGSIYGLHVIVPDIEAARSELVGRGVDVSDFFHFGPRAGGWAGPGPQQLQLVRLVRGSDGNTWLVQEVDRTKATQPAHDATVA